MAHLLACSGSVIHLPKLSERIRHTDRDDMLPQDSRPAARFALWATTLSTFVVPWRHPLAASGSLGFAPSCPSRLPPLPALTHYRFTLFFFPSGNSQHWSFLWHSELVKTWSDSSNVQCHAGCVCMCVSNPAPRHGNHNNSRWWFGMAVFFFDLTKRGKGPWGRPVTGRWVCLDRLFQPFFVVVGSAWLVEVGLANRLAIREMTCRMRCHMCCP